MITGLEDQALLLVEPLPGLVPPGLIALPSNTIGMTARPTAAANSFTV
jgi:hypothetical protein